MARENNSRGVSAEPNTWSRLGWYGWQVESPAEWNPVILQGDDRRGSVVLADLESARLELTWLSWSGRKQPDLTRSVEKQLSAMVDAEVLESDRWPLAEVFGDARVMVSEVPREVRLVLSSSASRRVVVVRVCPQGLDAAESTMYRLVTSLNDLSDQPMVPWSIYGFEFAAPGRCRLASHQLQTGATSLAFKYGRGERLRFSRGIESRRDAAVGFVDRPGEPDVELPGGYALRGEDVITHLGHEVTVRRAERTGWRSIIHRGERTVATASWHCPACDRAFQITKLGREADDDLVRELISRVICHR